jgi:aspartate kinase
MAVLVQKYGGSSVADIEKLHAVADRVALARRSGHDVVVVVSAMGKTTENLLSLARDAARAPDGADGAEPEPPRRELDMLVSTGERVSMALLSIAMQARGLDAISFTGSQSGIITNDRHFDARIIEVRPHRIEDELYRGRVVIVAGYQGMSYRREITTLGRGGSDTTAVALAAALGAERCEIYSDVDGVYSADPQNVPDAHHLPELDYATMQEMAESGAKVLCAQAVEWAKQNRVTIVARRTSDPATGNVRETRIAPDTESTPSRAVVMQRQIALLRAPAGAPLFEAAAEAGLPLADATLDEHGVRACVPLRNVPDFARSRRVLESALGEGLSIELGLGRLSLVGVEVGSRPALVDRALALLGAPPVWLLGTPLRISAVLPEAALPAAERAWHDEFGGSDALSADPVQPSRASTPA